MSKRNRSKQDTYPRTSKPIYESAYPRHLAAEPKSRAKQSFPEPDIPYRTGGSQWSTQAQAGRPHPPPPPSSSSHITSSRSVPSQSGSRHDGGSVVSGGGSTSRRFVDGLEDEMTCPICMSVMVGPHQLSPCGHALCGPCGVTWLESRASAGETVNCPTCREGVNPNQPLIPARNLEKMIKKWIELRKNGWEGIGEWKDREETWKVHKQFNPTLVSPELFPPTSQRGRSSNGDRELQQILTAAWPDPRDYFDDGPRGARRSMGGGRQGQGWVAQGFGDLSFPDMDFPHPAQRNNTFFNVNGTGMRRNNPVADLLRSSESIFSSLSRIFEEVFDVDMANDRRRWGRGRF